MEINHIQENIKSGYFTAIQNESEAGRITYVMPEGNKLVIDHTEVSTAYGGRGLGKKLVFAVADYARANDLKIFPQCTFAKAVFDKTPEIQGLLA
jgi:predicted GNAT family acetyltransferase